MEVQINGGSISDKVEFARELFEKKVPIKSTFAKDEMVDIIGVTKGKGFKGNRSPLSFLYHIGNSFKLMSKITLCMI